MTILLNDLPNEILYKIFDKIKEVKDLRSIHKICKRFSQIIETKKIDKLELFYVKQLPSFIKKVGTLKIKRFEMIHNQCKYLMNLVKDKKIENIEIEVNRCHTNELSIIGCKELKEFIVKDRLHLPNECYINSSKIVSSSSRFDDIRKHDSYKKFRYNSPNLKVLVLPGDQVMLLEYQAPDGKLYSNLNHLPSKYFMIDGIDYFNMI